MQIILLLCIVIATVVPLRMLLVFPKDQLRLFSLILYLNLVMLVNTLLSILLQQPRPFWLASYGKQYLYCPSTYGSPA